MRKKNLSLEAAKKNVKHLFCFSSYAKPFFFFRINFRPSKEFVRKLLGIFTLPLLEVPIIHGRFFHRSIWEDYSNTRSLLRKTQNKLIQFWENRGKTNSLKESERYFFRKSLFRIEFVKFLTSPDGFYWIAPFSNYSQFNFDFFDTELSTTGLYWFL